MRTIILLIAICGLLFNNVQAQKEQDTTIMKPALIIIDIQNEFIPRMSEQEKKYVFDVITDQYGFSAKTTCQ